MCASSSSTSSTTHSQSWISFVNVHHWNAFIKLAPCVYTELTPEKVQKKNEEGFPKYFPLVLYGKSNRTRTIYIFLSALSLLNITPEKAFDAVKTSSFYHLVYESLNGMSLTQQRALELFAPIIEEYRRQEANKMLVCPSTLYPRYPKYNKRNLVELFQNSVKALTVHYPSLNICFARSTVDSPLKTGLFEMPAGKFASTIAYNRIAIISPSGRFLGKGRDCTVYQVYDYSLGKFLAIKTPNFIVPENTEEEKNSNFHTQSQISREIQVVTSLYKNVPYGSSLEGIMSLPSSVLTFSNSSKDWIYQSPIYPQYLGTIKDYVNRKDRTHHTLPNLISACEQIFRGIKHLNDNHIIHGDIKTDNVLIESLDPLVVKISDFSGCKIESEIQLNCENITGTVYSPIFLNQNDVLELAKYIQQGDLANWTRVSYSRDIAAAGLTCLEMVSLNETDWSGTQHIKQLKKFFSYGSQEMWAAVHYYLELLDLTQATEEAIKELLAQGGHSNAKLADLFSWILNDDWSKRPSAELVLQSLRDIRE